MAECGKEFAQFGLAKKSKEKPQNFLVHPSNRHGQGINAYSSHTKGCLIVKNGADPDTLLKSTSFELSSIKRKGIPSQFEIGFCR